MATKKKFLGNNGLDANNQTISNVATPSASSDASTKGYADTLVPSQAGNTGKYLTTNGSATSWATVTASASAEALTGTTIASNVTGSSLTSVGTLGSLTVSGNATFDTNTLFVDATNDRVGVGTVSPSTKLDVNGGDLLVDASSVGDERGIFFRRGFTSTDKYNVSILVKDHDGNFPDGLSINAYDGISFCTGSNARNERMRLNVNGNLGLSTTNPVYKMQIEPTSVTAGGVNNLLRIGTQSTTTGTTSRFSMFCSTDPVSDTNGGKVFIDAIRTATNMDLAFSLNNTGGASPVERMRLTGEGNLGIGTAGPSAKLDVVGTNFSIRPGSVNGIGHFNVTNEIGSPISTRLAFGTDNTGWQMRFAKNYQGTYTDYMTINDAGNIGIGTVSPAYKLDVNGTLNASGSITQNGSQVLTAGNYSSYAIPVSGGINMSGGYGLNDQRLFLRTNGDTNHYLWNANDDWEELVAYAGTGFRIASSNGASLMTFTTSAVNSGVALQQGGNQVLHAGNFSSYTLNRNGDNTTGVMYFRSDKGGSSYLGGQSNYSLQAYSSDGGSASMSFHRGGYYAVNMGLDPDNVFRIGGWSASANRLQLDMSGNLTVPYTYANSFNIINDSNNAFTQGALQLRDASATIYLRDTNHNSAMIHCNSNIFYILRGGNDTTTWATTNGYWPLEINLTNNDATFGRHIYAPAGYIHAVHFNQTSANSENPTVDQVIVTNGDNYFRKASKAHFKAQTGMYSNGGSSVSNNITISSSSATGGSNGDIWLKY